MWQWQTEDKVWHCYDQRSNAAINAAEASGMKKVFLKIGPHDTEVKFKKGHQKNMRTGRKRKVDTSLHSSMPPWGGGGREGLGRLGLAAVSMNMGKTDAGSSRTRRWNASTLDGSLPGTPCTKDETQCPKFRADWYFLEIGPNV